MVYRLTKYVLNKIREVNQMNLSGHEKIRKLWYEQSTKRRNKCLRRIGKQVLVKKGKQVLKKQK